MPVSGTTDNMCSGFHDTMRFVIFNLLLSMIYMLHWGRSSPKVLRNVFLDTKFHPVGKIKRSFRVFFCFVIEIF